MVVAARPVQANQEEVALLPLVIQEVVDYQCMALHPALQVNKIMAIGQSGVGGSLAKGHSVGSGLSMYGSSSSVTSK